MIRIPALYDKSTGVDGRPITSAGGGFHNNFGGCVVQTDVGILPVINITGGSSVDGTFNLATAPDFIGITTTEEYDAMLNYAYSIPWEIPIVVNLPTVSYSYAGYYARAGLVELGWTFIDSGLDTDLYAAEDYLNLGDELVVNGGFDTDTGWTKGTGWTISGGVASIGDVAYARIMPSPGLPISADTTYVVGSDIYGTNGGSARIYLGSSFRSAPITNHMTQSVTAITADDSDNLLIYNISNTELVVDNISVREILDGPYTGN